MQENISEIRKRPGESNAGKYEHVKSSNFAGPDKTFPINTMARGRNALARAHFAKKPESIKEKVYAKYPVLKKNHEERTQEKDGLVSNFGQPHKELGHMSYGDQHEMRKKNDKRHKAYNK